MWRYSSKNGRFFFVDIGAAFALLPLLFFLNLNTLMFSMTVIIIFGVIEHFGFPPGIAIRYSVASIGQAIGGLSGIKERALGPWRVRRALFK